MELINSVGIKDLAPMERPRERLRYFGAAALSDVELLAVLLGSGTRKLSVLEVCRQIMHALDGDIENLMKLDVDALCGMTGIGEVRALTFLATVALAKRLKVLNAEKAAARLDDRGIAALLRPVFEKSEGRMFLIVLLTDDRRLLATAELAVSSNGFPDISQVMKLVTEAGANRFIVARNGPHPEAKGLGGNEKSYFRQVGAAADMLNLAFEGLIIFAGDSVYKFGRYTGGDLIKFSTDQCKRVTTY